MAEQATESLKRPGGPLQQKPLEIDGKTYDPFKPPQMIIGPGGKVRAIEHIDFGLIVKDKPNVIQRIVEKIKSFTTRT